VLLKRGREIRERERGIEKEGGSPPADDRGMFPKESFEKEKKGSKRRLITKTHPRRPQREDIYICAP
jgi:hypothetical protein